MPAEQEEIVVHANCLKAQQSRKHHSQPFLERRARADKDLARQSILRIRRRQRVFVSLPILRRRQ